MKPANVLLDRTGKHAKLADVGLAKVLEHSHTMTNLVSIHSASHPTPRAFVSAFPNFLLFLAFPEQLSVTAGVETVAHRVSMGQAVERISCVFSAARHFGLHSSRNVWRL